MEQDGEGVSGRYAPQQGRIAAKVSGSRLEGRWIEGDQSGTIELLLNRGGSTFVGRSEGLGWWTGRRVASVAGAKTTFDRSTPSAAWSGFLVAANRARSGAEEAWDTAAQAVEFAPGTGHQTSAQSMHALREYFGLIDLTTFEWWAVPLASDGDTAAFKLEQLRSGQSLTVTMNRDAQGQWRLVIPGDEERRALRASLLKVYGDDPPSGRSFLRRQTPRDTMRMFLEGMSDWHREGRAQVLQTMDLRGIPELLQKSDGALHAEYLRRALQKIGMAGLQSIPNDRLSREPYVHFVHASGSIVIAPSGPEPEAPWQFTQSTVSKVPEIYFALSELPDPDAVPLGTIPERQYFSLREVVTRHVPSLLRRVGRMELWQILILLATVPTLVVVARWLAGLVVPLLQMAPGGDAVRPKFFAWALAILLTLAGLRQVSYLIVGVSERSRSLVAPAAGTLLVLAAAVVAWNILSMISTALMRRAQKTRSRLDDILVNLLVTGGRIAIVVTTALAIAYLMSIPSVQILAGLGIGGLAFAIAARDTLSNFFGAGIIVTDRPFRTGDWINAGTVQGTVEEVGIRSTRIRTADDSVAIIPNGKLSDLPILNLGARRRRAIAQEILVTDGATAERLQAYMDGVRGRLASDPVFLPGETTLGIHNIGKDGIALALRTWVNVRDDAAELAARHNLLVDLMALAREHGLKIGRGMEETAISS